MDRKKNIATQAYSAYKKSSIPNFYDKRVLLLQGPIGPFFWNLAKDLRQQGALVFKFNFNAGDWLFYPRNAQRFTGNLNEWPRVLQKFLWENEIDVVMLFGDCRPVHEMVRALSQKMGFVLGVFEEGYLRPDHITFECQGVNGYSRFTENRVTQGLYSSVCVNDGYTSPVATATSDILESECSQQNFSSSTLRKVGNAYWHAAYWGMLYFGAAWLAQYCWNNSLHHRRLSIADAPWWWLSYGRKQWYRWNERKILEKLAGELKNRFFLVPLQVHNDAQVIVHSHFDSVCHFIDMVMHSYAFALKSNQLGIVNESVLVFKHHPMDRGYRNYATAIRRLTERYGIQGRVFYIHDQHLPSLLKTCRGVVLINSTTGLSALGHGAPVKVCGHALYDLPGLTFQGRLSDFWHEAASFKPQADLLRRFKQELLERTQINGNFYKKLSGLRWSCGVVLNGKLAERLWPQSALAHKEKQLSSIPVLTSEDAGHIPEMELS